MNAPIKQQSPQQSENLFSLCLYESHNAKTGRKITYENLLKCVNKPLKGQVTDPTQVKAKKQTLPLITPYISTDLTKTQTAALTARYGVLVLDFDHEQVRTLEGTIGLLKENHDYTGAILGFTTSSHTLNGENAFKVILPLADACDVHQYEALSVGLMKLLDTDPAQARKQQGFYAPCDMLSPSVYQYVIDDGDSTLFSPQCELWQQAIQTYIDGIEQQQQAAIATSSKPRPKAATAGNSQNIFELINKSYDMAELLERAGHKRLGRKWLSPHSTSGFAGGLIFDTPQGQRFYSHSSSCPLGKDANGHSLDIADVLAVTCYAGDYSEMIQEQAKQLDQDGQKQRQRDYMQAQEQQKNASVNANNHTDKTDKTTTDKPTVWSELHPIDNKLLPVKPMTENMLPTELADYVFDAAYRADNSSPDAVAVAVLTTLGATLGAKVAIHPKHMDSWQAVPNLWGGIVAPPSSKKSPLLNAGITFVNELESIEADKVRADEKVHKIEVKKLDVSIKTTNKKIDAIIKAISEDESKELDTTDKEKQRDALLTKVVELEEEKDEMQTPKAKRFKTNDGTPEAVAEILKVNTDGILVFRDELVGFLQSLEKGGEDTGRSFYLEGFDGDKGYNQDRIGRGSINIKNLCISVLGGIQPDKLTGYIEQQIGGGNNDGLLQRFQLLVYPDTTEWQHVDIVPNNEAKKVLKRIYTTFANLSEADCVKFGAKKTEYDKFPYFRFSDEAYELFKLWREHLNTVIKPNENEAILVEHLGKYESLVAKLALIFHLIDCITMGVTGAVSKASAQMALEWAEYLESHARRIYGTVINAHDMRAGHLADKLKKLTSNHVWVKDGFTFRDVERKNWKGLTDAKYIGHALDVLEKANYIAVQEIEPTVKGGRPTKRYWISPKIYGKH